MAAATDCAAADCADARFEGPHLTGDAAVWGLFQAMSGRYTVFFDRKFATGDLLRTYDGKRYYRMESLEAAYCYVVSVSRDEFSQARAKNRGWDGDFPWETTLRIIRDEDRAREGWLEAMRGSANAFLAVTRY